MIGTSHNFFETDAQIAKRIQIDKIKDNKEGDPIRLSSKALCMAIHSNNVFIGEAGALAKKYCMESKKPVTTFKGHSAPVCAIAVNGAFVITGSWDKTIRAYDHSGNHSKSLIGHNDFVKCIHFVNHKVIISGSSDKTIRVWNLEEDECTSVIKVMSAVQSICIAEEFIFVATSDSVISKYTLQGNLISSLNGHETSVFGLFQTDSETLFSCSADNTVIQWDLYSEKVADRYSHEDWVTAITFWNGKLVTASRDGKIRIISIATGNVEHVFWGHFDHISAIGLLDDKLISVSLDCTLRSWSIMLEENSKLMTEEEERELEMLLE